jgi:PmbA protein
MKTELMKLALERSKDYGFEAFEVYSESGKNFSVKVFEGDIDTFNLSSGAGVSVRGILNGKMGYGFTEILETERDLEILMKQCHDNAAINESDIEPVLYRPSAEVTYPIVEMTTATFFEIEPAVKTAALIDLEKKMRQRYPEIDRVNYNLYSEGKSQVRIQNTLGLDLAYESDVAYAIFAPIVKRGEETRNEHQFAFMRHFEPALLEKVAVEATEASIAMLGAATLPSGDYRTALRYDAAVSLFEAMVSVFSAEAVEKGLSALKNKQGQAIASDALTVVENPHLKDGPASVPFDSEGVPTRLKSVIDRGVLTTFLHNLRTAAKAGVEPTGNGFRGSYKSSVGIAPTNFYVAPGTISADGLLKNIGDGLLITALDGLHSGLNAISGDFSLSARGFRIQNGAMGAPVTQITVAGNFFELLRSIVAVADDLKFESVGGNSAFGAPTMDVGILAISGS